MLVYLVTFSQNLTIEPSNVFSCRILLVKMVINILIHRKKSNKKKKKKKTLRINGSLLENHLNLPKILFKGEFSSRRKFSGRFCSTSKYYMF